MQREMPGWMKSQARIKIARRNINNLIYADDTTLRAESEEELKSLLMKVKGKNEKAGLKLNIQKTKTMASCPISLWQIDQEKVGIVEDFIFLGSKITANGEPWRAICYDPQDKLSFKRKHIINWTPQRAEGAEL